MKKAVLLSVILLTTSFSKDIVELGIEAYDQGNYYKAAEIFSTACDDGNAECCNMLGALYSDGLGVKVDYHKAAWLYKKACDGKSAIACSNLGDQYRDGIGVKQDIRKAIELYEKACEGKYAES